MFPETMGFFWGFCVISKVRYRKGGPLFLQKPTPQRPGSLLPPPCQQLWGLGVALIFGICGYNIGVM